MSGVLLNGGLRYSRELLRFFGKEPFQRSLFYHPVRYSADDHSSEEDAVGPVSENRGIHRTINKRVGRCIRSTRKLPERLLYPKKSEIRNLDAALIIPGTYEMIPIAALV